MGKDVSLSTFTREDRTRYRQKVRRCLDVFASMLNDFRFDADRPMTGLELELNLIDPEGEPAMCNAQVLDELADPSFQTELGQFNLEINLKPRLIAEQGFDDYEDDLRTSLARADDRAKLAQARLVTIGILPTLTQGHAILENLSTDPRYRVLNEQIVSARGEDITLDIRGVESLQSHTDSIAPEAACTSTQFHLQVAPEDFASYLEAGGVPRLSELRLHNGTIYRWNRPVYDIMNGRPHLRVENRVLPAGPTVVDLLANAAFYFGLVRSLAEADRPVWTQLTFGQAEENFHVAARDGLQAAMYWPRLGELRATDLVLERLLPWAHDGLDRFDVDPALRDRLLGVVEQRCLTGRNGASWQTDTVEALERDDNLTRPAALREMLRRYAELASSNEPVHTWPVE